MSPGAVCRWRPDAVHLSLAALLLASLVSKLVSDPRHQQEATHTLSSTSTLLRAEHATSFLEPGDSSLAFVALQTPIVSLDTSGRVAALKPGTRLAIDVGLGKNSPTAQMWLKLFPNPADLHVFGVEGNPITAWSLKLALDPHYANNISQFYKTWAAPQDLESIERHLGVLKAQHAQYTLIPAALGSTEGFLDFNLGDYRLAQRLARSRGGRGACRELVTVEDRTGCRALSPLSVPPSGFLT